MEYFRFSRFAVVKQFFYNNQQEIEGQQIHMEILRFPLFSLILASVIASPLFGPTLLQNTDFSQPSLPSNNLCIFYENQIPGWSCTKLCELDNCSLIKQRWIFGDCFNQVLDINSNYIQTVTQVFSATDDPHLLNFTFLYPLSGTTIKTLFVYLNHQLVYRFLPTVKDYLNHTVGLYIHPKVGLNNLSFTSDGPNDTQGYRLINVNVYRQINPQIISIVQSFTQNAITTTFIQIPGLRVIFGQLINSFVSFDRMQLYYYHDRVLSDYSQFFLKEISTMMSLKGKMFFNLQQKILGKAGNTEQSFIQNQEYKQSYINVQSLSNNSNGYGFVSNNTDLVVYSIPFMLCLMFAFYIIFQLTFQWKISKLFRKYSFFGILIIMIMEGNIEQFIFYAFGEFTTFFTSSFSHKIVNIFIVVFTYVVLFTGITIYILFKIYYKQRVCYFIQNSKANWTGIVGFTIDRGIICLLFGAAHQLLLKYPNFQLLTLGFIQAIWIFVQIMRIMKNIYEHKFIVWLSIFEGFLRIIFQLSLYLYAQYFKNGILKYLIGDKIHITLVLLFLINWGIQFTANIVVSGYQIFVFVKEYKIINKHFKPKKKYNKKLIMFQMNKLSPFFK